MKVKLTYTADYEDVPQIINEIVEKCRNNLKRSSEFKFNFLDLEKTAAEIMELQSTMSLVSSQLEDCYNMYRGYLQASQGEEQELTTEGIENEET